LDPNQPRIPNNPFWIYPLDVLEIKCEITTYAKDALFRGIHAHFMNLELYIKDDNSGLYRTTKFDKRRNLPFRYSQYIQFRSNRPIRQSYSIAISQTVPVLYLSSDVDAAHKELEMLVSVLQSNGFQRHRLICNITKFLRENTFPGIKYEISSLLQKFRY